LRRVRLNESFALILSLIILILWHLSVTQFSTASTETIVKVDPEEHFAKVSETFKINISVINVENLYGVEVNLYWNPSVLKLINISVRLGIENNPDGVLFNPISIYKNETTENGRYVIAGSSSSPAPSFNGSGNIVQLTFKVIGFGNSVLDLETELASNIMTPTGVEPITHTTIDGFYYPIQVSANPEDINLGENISIQGIISKPQANTKVKILYKRSDSTEWKTIGYATTDDQGKFSYTWTPTESGTYHVKCTASIENTEGTSPILSVKVKGEVNWPYWLLAIIAAAIIAILIIAAINYKRLKRRSNPH